jgi:hypothetical protein
MVEIPDTAENAAACLCGNCPSKAPDECSFYCVKGPSALPVNRGFCACRWCPLWSCYGLAGDFYCDVGAGDASEAETGGEPANGDVDTVNV